MDMDLIVLTPTDLQTPEHLSTVLQESDSLPLPDSFFLDPDQIASEQFFLKRFLMLD